MKQNLRDVGSIKYIELGSCGEVRCYNDIEDIAYFGGYWDIIQVEKLVIVDGVLTIDGWKVDIQYMDERRGSEDDFYVNYDLIIKRKMSERKFRRFVLFGKEIIEPYYRAGRFPTGRKSEFKMKLSDFKIEWQ